MEDTEISSERNTKSLEFEKPRGTTMLDVVSPFAGASVAIANL